MRVRVRISRELQKLENFFQIRDRDPKFPEAYFDLHGQRGPREASDLPVGEKLRDGGCHGGFRRAATLWGSVFVEVHP